MDGFLVDVLYSQAYQVFLESLSHKSCQENIDWLLESNRTAQLLLLLVDLSNLLQDLNTILLRHLKVQQHKTNGPDCTVNKRHLHRLFDNLSCFIDYMLAMHTVSAFILHSDISELGF